MTTRKSLPIALLLLLCIAFIPITSSSGQTITSAISEYPAFSCYRNAESLIAKMKLLAPTDSSLSELRAIGSSVAGTAIYALEIGNEAIVDKPHFILLTGLHGNDFSQPELGLQFAEKLLEDYETDADLRWIVDNVELDLILVANPDGRIQAELQANQQIPEPFIDPPDVDNITNSNGYDLEENFCFPIAETSVSCGDFTYQSETQAIMNYLNLKLGESVPNQPPQYDSRNLFMYFSSHNKEVLPTDIYSNYKERLRIPKFFLPYTQALSDPALLPLQELTELLRIVGTSPIYNIETFKTEAMQFDNYSVDYVYFTHGIASIELSAPPKDDSRPMDCSLFTTEHRQNNVQLLLNAAKSASQPYQIGYGPIVRELEKTSEAESVIQYRAILWEKNQGAGQYDPNPITSIQYFIDQPTGTVSGNLDEWNVVYRMDNVWEIDFGIDISTLELGEHVLTLQACNAAGKCGLPLSEFLIVRDPDNPDDPEQPDPGDPDPPDGGDSKIYLPLIGR